MRIRSGAEKILSESTFSDEARKRSRALQVCDGAVLAADSVEALIQRTAAG
jgi:hypothetical protein